MLNLVIFLNKLIIIIIIFIGKHRLYNLGSMLADRNSDQELHKKPITKLGYFEIF